jgi:hypothetical protein
MFKKSVFVPSLCLVNSTSMRIAHFLPAVFLLENVYSSVVSGAIHLEQVRREKGEREKVAQTMKIIEHILTSVSTSTNPIRFMFQSSGVVVNQSTGLPVVESTFMVDTPHKLGDWVRSVLLPLKLPQVPEYKLEIMTRHVNSFSTDLGDYRAHKSSAMKLFTSMKNIIRSPLPSVPIGYIPAGAFMHECPSERRFRCATMVAAAMMATLSGTSGPVPRISGDHFFVKVPVTKDLEGKFSDELLPGSSDDDLVSLSQILVLRWMNEGQWRRAYSCPGDPQPKIEIPLDAKMACFCNDSPWRKSGKHIALIGHLAALETELVLRQRKMLPTEPDASSILMHLHGILEITI